MDGGVEDMGLNRTVLIQLNTERTYIAGRSNKQVAIIFLSNGLQNILYTSFFFLAKRSFPVIDTRGYDDLTGPGKLLMLACILLH